LIVRHMCAAGLWSLSDGSELAKLGSILALALARSLRAYPSPWSPTRQVTLAETLSKAGSTSV